MKEIEEISQEWGYSDSTPLSSNAMFIFNRILATILVFACLYCTDAIANTYLIGQGDVLSVRIYNENGLDGDYSVSETGTIKLPLIGEVSVAGLAPIDASEMLEECYKDGFLVSPNINIEVKVYASQQVQVLGAVETPGMISLTRSMTLLDVFALVGGVKATDKSSQEVVIQRGGVETQRIPVAPLLTMGSDNIQVESGDIIFVTSGMTVYVSGKVKKAGAIPYHSGLHLTEALALSGGAERTANLRTVYILRNGTRIPVNLRRVIKGRIADTPLQQGDYIVVEESFW